ncbi:hypothetical protein T265_04679 [Opisthorchis viverrini]|uniref:Uncharacterized protein n=1 Tax=Opisthorchis viverrini TaxID=6198 RepID=A0A074ZRU1_OPIVI|nr:hypothetical protein T265_04679 [Opisthorchis viverrini]KER28547.1 hypothetical protein T265_04679 [Opisthorchis viverrini]
MQQPSIPSNDQKLAFRNATRISSGPRNQLPLKEGQTKLMVRELDVTGDSQLGALPNPLINQNISRSQDHSRSSGRLLLIPPLESPNLTSRVAV